MLPPYAIGPFTYRTKKEATDHIRRILHTAAPPRQRLTGTDADLVAALVRRHPSAAEKIGAGIDTIEVRTVEYGQPGFWLTRVDGTSTEFSYRKALNVPTHRAEALATMRRAVADQIFGYRRSVFADTDRITCPLTGDTLTEDFGQVDHDDPQFVTIAEEFADMVGGWERIKLVSADAMIGKEFRHDIIDQSWQQWHKQRAVLRYIHPGANGQRGTVPR